MNHMMRSGLALALLMTAPAMAAPEREDATGDEARADVPVEAAMRANAIPMVLHRPVASVWAGLPVVIEAVVQADWQVTEMAVHYREQGLEDWRSVPVQRARTGDWRAEIPGRDVNAAGLEYYIASRGVDGVERDHFATRAAPHPVRVSGDSPSDVQHDQLARYGGARSRVRVDGWMVAYGSVEQGRETTDRFSDRLWQAEAEYIFRPLNLLHDMRFGFGLMRAEWPAVDDAPVSDADTPGLNYGYGEVNFELHRWFSAGGRLVLGASGLGFTAGVGAVARVGDMSGTHFEARWTTIGDIGAETALTFRWDTVPRFPMSLGIEFTDWPAGDADAANLIYEAGFELDARWTVNARVGSAGRSNSLDGGFQGGLGLMADF